MKLSDKISKLDNTLRHLKQLNLLCPDIELIKSKSGSDLEYYSSVNITKTGKDVEFLCPTSSYNAIHKACVFTDYDIEGTNYRIYGKPAAVKLFVTFSKEDNFKCYDYTSILEKVNVNPVALRKMHMYVINFMNNNEISVDKNSLSDNIRNLLAFM